MTPGPLGILSLVGLAGRALAGPGQAQPAISKSDLADLDFEKLLNKARSGNIASGKQVVLGSEVAAELSDEQVQRLTAAADRAAAHGATTAMVLMDGQGYVLNVESRQVEAIVDEQAATVMTDIDAVITAPRHGQSVGTESLPMMPSNESLMRMLADAGH